MHCGMRAITRGAWERIKATSTGMEFASEMLIKAAKKELKILETPIKHLLRKGTNSKLNLKRGLKTPKTINKLSFTKIFKIK
jgi:hypothetical protein